MPSEFFKIISCLSLARVCDIELLALLHLILFHEMVLVPMKDAGERSLAQFLYCSPSRNRLESQYICSLVDAQHGDTFRCGKANLRQRVQRVLPAEISTYHLQAGDTALHAVMLVNNLNITHKQLQY